MFDLSVPEWTEQRINLLKSMHRMHRNMDHMMRVLGVSKNAITGKLSRLGLTRRMKDEPAPLPKRFIARPKDPPNVHLSQLPDLKCKNIALTDLTLQHCRWPLDLYVSDVEVICPPFQHSCGTAHDIPVFCGLTRIGGSVYCPAHDRIAHPRTIR